MSKIKYTLEEISRFNGIHNTRIWILIRESVYDVTDYLSMHPGGSELIMEYAGKDATAAFDDFGHSSDARHSIKQYKIGEVVKGDELKKNKKKNRTVDKTNNEHIKSTKGRHRLLFPLFRSCCFCFLE